MWDLLSIFSKNIDILVSVGHRYKGFFSLLVDYLEYISSKLRLAAPLASTLFRLCCFVFCLDFMKNN